MSKKGLKSMKDEKKELQKQIGCITGFFQLFDRHRFITGQRTTKYIQNASSLGVTNNGNKELDSTKQKPKEKNQKIAKEKQQFSTESSVTSVSSSSCSSSMTSYEFNGIIKTESLSTKQIQISRNPHSKVSVDFFDIVKDSMHREAKELYVKTLTKQEIKGHGYSLNQHIDSPRPVIVSKEPLHTLSRSKKAHWDSPRLSYDALKSTTRYKELPRLSLDSKQGSIRGIDEGNKARNVSNGSQRGYERNSSAMLDKIQEPETSKRSSSVVVKLMGLEALPDSTQTGRTSVCSTDKNEIIERTITGDEYKKHQSSVSPRNRRGNNSTINVKPTSRFMLEPTTPWKQSDADQNYLLQDSSKVSDSNVKASKPSLSVYGEIEKRLGELEFKKSGKDLRALKQILEAMQRFTDSSSDTGSNNASLSENSKVQSPRVQQKDFPSDFVTVEQSNSIEGSKLPIVITKPTKVTRKANNPPSTELPIPDKSRLIKCSPTNGSLICKQKAKGIGSTTKITTKPFAQQVPSADKNNYFKTSKSMQSSKSPHETNGQNTIASRRLEKKFGVERRSAPTSPSSDSTVNRRKHNSQLVELSTSSSSTSKQSSSISQDRDEYYCEMNSHWRKFKHHVNVISSDFGSNRSLATQSDIEVIHLDQSANINQNNTFEELRMESYKAAIIVTTEQPSPVSVLDAAFYKEDPPSPVKTKSNVSKNLGKQLQLNCGQSHS
ncbi:DUF4378 domain protein [Medicago truncatula]|uniref:DUF4378 domain protein n=1 Tax=Medicago truncatula TaxID=3880 RepID=A0A072U760_MEDTR|nr:DUF4378 domain protein [Medicago truncatula]